MSTKLTSYQFKINLSNFEYYLEISADFESTHFSKAKLEKEGILIMALSTGEDVCIGVIDVGSPKSGNLGWAIRKGELNSHGDDLDEFIAEFARHCDGCPAALGFEAPLFVPIRDKALELTNARKGEGSRPWSASAGATVLTVALPVVTYTLRHQQKHRYRYCEAAPGKPIKVLTNLQMTLSMSNIQPLV